MQPSALTVRPPAVAGAFYPGAADELARTVDALLADARTRTDAEAPAPKALIAPHAGYVYSGPIAATAYARLGPARSRITRVVLLGPAHRVAVRGLALPGVTALATPLGQVAVDELGVEALSGLPQVQVSRDAHALEHSLEVHLPFLQRALKRFTLVPLVVGRATPGEVAEVLERLWGGDETLIVVSSDLSHYLSYAEAQAKDRGTVRQILKREPVIDPYQACGATPINGLLVAAARRGLQPRLLDLRSSGDTAGDESRVVGYASFEFHPGDGSAATEADDPGRVLIPIARSAIGGVLGFGFETEEHHAFLHETGATFVTLTRHGRLRGCIGTLRPHRTLLEDVKGNAKAAAFLDPRFEPLTATELKTTLVEVSLLSDSEPITFASESQLVEQLRPGVDGVILQFGNHRGTFLPQVWEQLPDARQFLAQLKRKAGLPLDFWADGMRVSRYTVTKWSEGDYA
jgi:AmmeMemoRadiSam system protein B/AmmeMemoRadiSam system protein A